MRGLLISAVLAAASFAVPASAVTIPLSAKVAGPQSGPGTGLSGKFYDTNIGDAVAAHAPGALGAANGTFHSTTIDYCCGNDADLSVASFLGNDGASFVGTDPGDFSGSVLTFDGYINITEDMRFYFGEGDEPAGIAFMIGLGSDDGFDLVIGGVNVGSAGARGFSYSYLPVEFAEAGLYSFSLLYYENDGQNGLSIGRFMGEGTRAFDADVFFSEIPGSEDVPEPAMLGLFGLGAIGLGLARRRR